MKKSKLILAIICLLSALILFLIMPTFNKNITTPDNSSSTSSHGKVSLSVPKINKDTFSSVSDVFFLILEKNILYVYKNGVLQTNNYHLDETLFYPNELVELKAGIYFEDYCSLYSMIEDYTS